MVISHRESMEKSTFILRWGLELLVNEIKVGEHATRFAPDGKYAPLKVKDYAVIDLRGNETGEVTRVARMEKRVTVFFKLSDFTSCRCIFGMDKTIHDIPLKRSLLAPMKFSSLWRGIQTAKAFANLTRNNGKTGLLETIEHGEMLLQRRQRRTLRCNHPQVSAPGYSDPRHDNVARGGEAGKISTGTTQLSSAV
ncbi:hypothetical protein V7S43_009863 [Phytophthora oleae]|uniref:Uncharacterized protein n=1 Tax=Phytophthora oleae TaxID=2107226 RepID=A0ABD3FE71_9STRA